jgi:hypothetical protein
MRNLSPDIFMDDWFGSISPIQRLLWIGIITVMADDQGRFVNNPSTIKVKLFPYDNKITFEIVSASIKQFVKFHKLISYKFGMNGSTKECLQIANWWKYQIKAGYAAESILPPPTGWTDRVHCHAKGITGFYESGWNTPGGYCYPAPALPQPCPSPAPALPRV